jgi:hypothetical protein
MKHNLVIELKEKIIVCVKNGNRTVKRIDQYTRSVKLDDQKRLNLNYKTDKNIKYKN